LEKAKSIGFYPSAGWWEPDELRGSRPVLRGAGAEMPRPTHPDKWNSMSVSQSGGNF
jgi:hypothetical protein